MNYDNDKKREALICAAQLCNQKNITDASEILMQIHDELDRTASVMAIVDEIVSAKERNISQVAPYMFDLLDKLIAARKAMK